MLNFPDGYGCGFITYGYGEADGQGRGFGFYHHLGGSGLDVLREPRTGDGSCGGYSEIFPSGGSGIATAGFGWGSFPYPLLLGVCK